MQSSSTNEERVLAALSHAGVLVNSFNLLGLVGAAIIWATQRKQSAYVASHALQALIFQVLALLTLMILFFFWAGCLLIAYLPALLWPDLYAADLPLAFRLAVLVGFALLVIFVVGAVLYGLMGALAAWRGRMFRYAAVDALLQMQHPAPARPAPAVSPVDEAEQPREAAQSKAVPAVPPAPEATTGEDAAPAEATGSNATPAVPPVDDPEQPREPARSDSQENTSPEDTPPEKE